LKLNKILESKNCLHIASPPAKQRKCYLRFKRTACSAARLNVSGHQMTSPPKHTISSEDAMTLLNEGRPLTDLYVEGELKIETNDPWDKEIIIENCVIESFSGSSTLFIKQIKLKNCNFKTCQFIFTYFAGGLTIDN